MQLFGRRKPDPRIGSVDAFWEWWAKEHAGLAARMEGRGLDPKALQSLADAVHRLDERLAWELGPGATAKHALILSPEGNPGVRPLALRWQAAAPPADGTWEYHPSRPADPSFGDLRVGEHEVDLREMVARTTWDPNRELLDVALWHPAFPTLPLGIRTQVTFLYLDRLLGEDEVERWIGEIQRLEAPTDGADPDSLRAELDRRRAEATGLVWTVAQGVLPDGGPMIVAANSALKRIDHPFADFHLAATLGIVGEAGLPDDAEAVPLDAAEDRLTTMLGDAAVFVGRVTVIGKRTLHYVTGDPEQVGQAAERWAAAVEGREAGAELELDPAWAFRAQLLD
jgi:hypothetical protein